jgi:hypothetical protein
MSGNAANVAKSNGTAKGSGAAGGAANTKVIKKRNAPGAFRFRDLLIIILCLSGMVFFVHQFRLDLYHTINLQNVAPVGTVTVKNNVVQRRIEDRVLWDRLASESPVYLGDLVRVAELSEATLNIEGHKIDLYENTLVRIQSAPDGGIKIELSGGSMAVVATPESDEAGKKIQLSLNGRTVEAAPGSAIHASVGNEGTVVKVSEGKAVFVEEAGQSREIQSGAMLAMNNAGEEQSIPSVVMTLPMPNSSILKTGTQSVPIDFAWNRINLGSQDALRLEVSPDRYFSRNVRTFNNLISSANIPFDSGVWYWRLSFGGSVLASDRLTVIEAPAIDLLNPVRDSIIRYNDELPTVRFQWSTIEQASGYVIELSLLPEFINIQISEETTAASYIQPGMGPGPWYWRVRPVFPPFFEGSPVNSRISQFKIERVEQAVLAAEESVVLPEPEPPPPPPAQATASQTAAPPAPVAVPIQVALSSPAQGSSIQGLAALREPVEFRWESNREVVRSRFILSRNSNPLQGTPAREIQNPGRVFRVDNLAEGAWYWTVQAYSIDGSVSTAPARQFQVLPIPLLPRPLNLQPAQGYRIDMEMAKTQRSINFSWSPVAGANMYVFTLYERSESGLRQITGVDITRGTGWTLENLGMLSSGTFLWRVEAVNTRNGTIEQRGTPGENTFVIDVPVPEVRANSPGILYGN